MRLQLVAIGVAFPVKVDFDGDLGNPWDQFFVLLDQLVQGVVFLLPLRLGALRHKNLKNVCQPFLNLGSFEVLAESLQKAMLEL